MANIKLARVRHHLKSAPQCPPSYPDSTPVQPKNSFAMSALSSMKIRSYLHKSKLCELPIQPRNSFVTHSRYQNNNKTECKPLKHKVCQNANKVSREPAFSTTVMSQRKISSCPGSRDKCNTFELKGRLGISPLFCYQPAEKSLEHHLSLSEVMHIDIKPTKKSAMSFANFLRSTSSRGCRGPDQKKL